MRRCKMCARESFSSWSLNGLSRAEAQSEVERIAKDVLTNPVIEEFRFEVLD